MSEWKMFEVAAKKHTAMVGDPRPASGPPDPDVKRPALAGNRDGADLGRTGNAESLGTKQYHTPAGATTDHGVLVTPLQDLRADFYERASASPEWFAYVYGHGLDLGIVAAHAGAFGVCPTRFFPGRRFDFDDEGSPAAIIEVFDEDGETTVDLMAWPLDKPDQFACALGRADGLGLWQVRNPATYFAGRPLQVWRTPLAWLQASCLGAVVFDASSARSWLSAAPGLIAGEDIAHTRGLARLLHPFVEPIRILAPLREAA
jgi:hypothetical protein